MEGRKKKRDLEITRMSATCLGCPRGLRMNCRTPDRRETKPSCSNRRGKVD